MSRIGPVGTITRVVLGSALVYMAMTDDGRFFEWQTYAWYVLVGVVGFPSVMVIAGLATAAILNRPLRLVGPGGLVLNAALIFILLVNRHSHDAALLFYGVSFPIAAWRGVPGCEMTVISNMILDRDDQIGCPVMAPVDALEAAAGTSRQGRRQVHDSPIETAICLTLMVSLLWWFS